MHQSSMKSPVELLGSVHPTLLLKRAAAAADPPAQLTICFLFQFHQEDLKYF